MASCIWSNSSIRFEEEVVEPDENMMYFPDMVNSSRLVWTLPKLQDYHKCDEVDISFHVSVSGICSLHSWEFLTPCFSQVFDPHLS